MRIPEDDGSPEFVPGNFLGLVIKEASIEDNRLIIEFENDSRIVVEDKGQSCCEDRYMSTDDDLSSLIGRKFRNIEGKCSDYEISDDCGTHEICFVEVSTDQNFVTIVNHNKHNGYYGGFDMRVFPFAPEGSE